LPHLGRHRFAAEVVKASGDEFVLALLAPLEPIVQELQEVQAVLWASGPVALLIAATLAYGLARKALSPVESLRRSTESITADRLDQRLPVPHPSDGLGRLTRTINAMIGRLERSFSEVRRFTTDASHELRTPVTVIRTEAEVALIHLPEPEGCRQLLASIVEECHRNAEARVF
jgi:signal transduction histidine kinase